MPDDEVQNVQTAENEIAPGEFNRPSVACAWCQEQTKFDMPDEIPPQGIQHLVECEACGKGTPVPEVMFYPPPGDEAVVEVEE
jgi:hypothetical protein